MVIVDGRRYFPYYSYCRELLGRDFFVPLPNPDSDKLLQSDKNHFGTSLNRDMAVSPVFFK